MDGDLVHAASWLLDQGSRLGNLGWLQTCAYCVRPEQACRPGAIVPALLQPIPCDIIGRARLAWKRKLKLSCLRIACERKHAWAASLARPDRGAQLRLHQVWLHRSWTAK